MAMFSTINISDTELKQSAHQFRKELLVMPVIAAEATLQHMTARPGVAGKETVGQLSGNIEIGPYDPQRVDMDGVAIAPRTLETYLGSVVKKFDLNEAAKTVYGSLTTQGEALTSLDLAHQILNYLAMQLGLNLNKHIWDAKRNAAGTKTKDLFDGFDTITAAEITAGKIAAAEGNYLKLTEAIDDNSAFDLLTQIYERADDNLQTIPTKMFVPVPVYRAYNRAYLANFGSVVYNTQFKKTFLEGTDNLCEIVPLVSKRNSPYIHLTPKSNMIYGYGDGLDAEKLAIEKHHEFLLSFVATMFFGCQFETISKEKLFVAELKSNE